MRKLLKIAVISVDGIMVQLGPKDKKNPIRMAPRAATLHQICDLVKVARLRGLQLSRTKHFP
jgi:hypothetical protein